MTIRAQEHNQFKVFAGTPDAKGMIDELLGTAGAWANSAKVAPKSIGVEYLERVGRVVLTIGYRSDEAPYPVKLTCVNIARIESLDPDAVVRLEQAMAAASAKLPRIVCHELYVTDENDFNMVFMTHESV